MSAGPRWRLKVAGCAVLLSLFVAFPNHEAITNPGSLEGWEPVLEKIEAPFSQQAYGPGSHASKLTFRLSVPLFASALGLGIRGCLLLQFAAGILLLYFVAVATSRCTTSRRVVLFTTLLVACTHGGSTAFVEQRGIFDGVALCALCFSLASRSPVGIWVGVFVAAWTDERALIASGLVWLFHAQAASDDQRCRVASFTHPGPLAVLLAWLCYLAGRAYLSAGLGLTASTGGVGIGVLLDQINNAPMGLWTGLEGGWLLVVFALVVQYKRRDWLGFSLHGLLVICITTVGLMVVDITRSMAYLMPALLVSIRALSADDDEESLSDLCMLGFLTSLFSANYYAGGKKSIWWNYPLPLQVMRWIFRS